MNYFTIKCILLMILSSSVSERPKFRDDYRYEKTFKAFYKLHTVPMKWPQARVRCEAEGSELLVPESMDEVDSMPLIIGEILPNYIGVYIGIHDLYSLRTFVTTNGSVVDGTILELLWQYEEPKNSSGRCVAMRRNARLFVNECSSPLPFICKISEDRVKYYPECLTFDSRWRMGPTGNCYMAHSEPQTWYDAYSTCLLSGGHLAILNNRTEADFIRDLFRNCTEYRVPDSNFAFLGFSDLYQRHHFRTVHDGLLSATGFTDWDFKCTQIKENSGMERRCGGIRRSGLLSTANCKVPAMFFCEKPLNANATNSTLRNMAINEAEQQQLRRRKKKLLQLDQDYFTYL